MQKSATATRRTTGSSQKGSPSKPASPSKTFDEAPTETRKESSGTSRIEQMREYYFTSLFVCFAGIIGCYSYYAYLQESLISDKDKKLNTNFVMGVQSLIAVLISATIIRLGGMGDLFGENMSQGDLIVGLLNFFTMYCSNFALKFVNYPFMVLAKSAKILPIILTGWLSGVYKLTQGQVIIAITITSGLIVFNSGKFKKGGLMDDSLLGIGLVLLSLLFDGFVSSQTDKNHRSKKGRGGFAYHTMLYNNAVGLVLNIAFFAVAYLSDTDSTSDASITMQKVMNDFKIVRDVLLIGLCGAFGQIFIFLTISLHDCYKLSIVTTTRKCVSVVVSAFVFNHQFTPVQWTGACMVLGSTCAEVYLGNKRKAAAQAAAKKEEKRKLRERGEESAASTADDSGNSTHEDTTVNEDGKVKQN